jgi:predicted RNA polymerase sigma factor
MAQYAIFMYAPAVGCPVEAAAADHRALELTRNKAERDFLAARLGEVRQP